MIFNRFGFGIPLQNDILNKKEIKEKATRWLVKNFNDSFKEASPLDIKDCQNYYWCSWNNIDLSIELASIRLELSTPIECSVNSNCYYHSIPYSEAYRDILNIERIEQKCKKYLDEGNKKKCLILGCGTGESILALESIGIETVGMECEIESFKNANKLAIPNMIFGDILVDTQKFDNDSFDIVYTDRLSLIHKNDIEYFLSEIKRICRGLFFQSYITFDDSYKKLKQSWFDKQYEKVKMIKKSKDFTLCF